MASGSLVESTGVGYSTIYVRNWRESSEDGEMSIRLSREMQLTREEFLRELPGAVGNMEHRLQGSKVIVGDGDRRIEIGLVDEGIRDLGSLHLPMEKIDFEFHGYNQDEINSFMHHFDVCTQRGGG